MNLLPLFLLVAFVFSTCATAAEKQTNASDATEPKTVDNQAQVNPQEEVDDKKVAKRSYGWSPWGYGGYSFGWPWYGFGHGWYSGWYPEWPFFYGHGYGGYRGWYKGW